MSRGEIGIEGHLLVDVSTTRGIIVFIGSLLGRALIYTPPKYGSDFLIQRAVLLRLKGAPNKFSLILLRKVWHTWARVLMAAYL